MISFFALLLSTALAAEKPVTELEVRGYSPELNAIFANVYSVPDDGKCKSYILDFEKKTRFTLGPQPDIAKAVVALGEDNELSSCQLRSFDAQLEIKPKTSKTFTPEEKAKYEQYNTADWKKPIAGFKDKPAASLGAWLKKERPSFQPDLAKKLFELGYQEAEDGNWLDSYDALVIAADLNPKLANKESRAVLKKVEDKAAKESSPKALIMWEIATRLDPKAARPMLGLAAAGVAPARAFKLIQKALAADAVLTTRTYREAAEFKELRCDPKHASARKTLPGTLIQDVNCQ